MSGDILVIEQEEMLIERGEDVLIDETTIIEIIEINEQGPRGAQGEAFANLDGGSPTSEYGGTAPIDAGGP
jgi:hypothetical protein